MKTEPKTLPGFMELMPSDQILFNQMKDIIKKTYELYGFLPLDTPVIEFSNVLLAKAGGETEKQIYRFNKGDNDLSLRFDLTVPLAKYVAKRYNDLAFPFKRYQIGKVYRGERPQKGRFREFYQCDIDIIGDNELSLMNDAEIPSIINDVFTKLNIGDFMIRINNRKILNGLFESLNLEEKSTDILRVIDKIDKIGVNNVVIELKKLEIDDNSIESIITFIKIKGNNNEKINLLKKLKIENENFKTGVNELETVINYLNMLNIDKNNYEIDLTIARGLDYYTGIVYETILKDYPNIGSVCSGGRYDNLAEYYTDNKLPGVGISIGLTRLFYQLKEAGIISSNTKTTAKVLIIPMLEDLKYCLLVAKSLRENDINVDICSINKNMKQKLKYANKLKVDFTAIIGDEEEKNRVLTLKNMNTGVQAQLSIEESIKLLKNVD